MLEDPVYSRESRSTTGPPQGSPQHHLRGLRGGDGVEERVGRILRTKCQGFLRTGAEATSNRGVRGGTKPRSGGWDWGRPLGGL